MESIRIRGARENNLRNLDIDIPRHRLVVISGLSGSGKSSLLFDTLYAEGQRRYVESLSTYTRQFLERLRRPDLDSLEGIGPAVAIQQKNTVQHGRSTVASYTELSDFLRVLFARAGTLHCPGCGDAVKREEPSGLAAELATSLADRTLILAFPYRFSAGLKGEQLREILLARGFARVRLADGIARIDDAPADALVAGPLLVVVDRLKADPEDASRLAEAIEIAYHEGDGRVRVLNAEGEEISRHAEGSICAACDLELPEPRPSFFSYQQAEGACPDCRGYGNQLEFDVEKLVPRPSLTLAQGALAPWASPRFARFQQRLLEQCRERGIPTDRPYADLDTAQREFLIHGTGGKRGEGGVLPWLVALRGKAYKKYARFYSRRFMSERICETCDGSRLRPEVEQVRLGEWTLPALYRLDLGKAADAISSLVLDAEAAGVVRVLAELQDRLGFLLRMGLHYLGLDRPTRTLSGGEFQRIHLANALGSRLTDTLYALDEPTVGLHPRDTERLLSTLEELRDLGNSVVVVEHDLELIRGADQLLDMGPGSGAKGGELVYQGPVGNLDGLDPDHPSPTLRTLAGLEPLGFLDSTRRPPRGAIELEGVSKHNLRRIDVAFPLGRLVAVSGVSGSGKSTLVADVLVQALSSEDGPGPEGHWKRMRGADRVHGFRVVDQSPVGKSPRSNPATYLGAFQFIRQIYADRPEARKRHLGVEHFSFNSKEGRCPECKGLGSVKLEMVFMADLYVPCDACRGSRFRAESLQVRYKGKTLAEALEMTVDEAIHFFSGHHALGEKLWMLHRVGLGYLGLGQGASTLSGGESQRLKIARELATAGAERNLYILDEPTTGLHPLDVRQLLAVFQRLLKAGHSIIVVEHNLQVLMAADHIIDLGPGGGPEGGRIVAQGTPHEVAASRESLTAAYLKPVLAEADREDDA